MNKEFNKSFAKVEVAFRNLAIIRKKPLTQENFSCGTYIAFCDRKSWKNKKAYTWSFNPEFFSERFPIYIGKVITLPVDIVKYPEGDEVTQKFKIISVIENDTDQMMFRVRPIGIKKRIKHYFGIFPWWK